MPIVDADGMPLEDGVHLEDDGGAAGFDAVVLEHRGDVVGEDLVRVQDVLVVVHGEEVDAFGRDGEGGVGSRGAVEDAGTEIGDRLDDSGAAGGFDVVEHDDLGDGGIELVLHQYDPRFKVD